jgi:hypothetical protein
VRKRTILSTGVLAGCAAILGGVTGITELIVAGVVVLLIVLILLPWVIDSMKE